LLAAAQLAHQQSDNAATQQLVDESLMLFHQFADQRGVANALRERGWLAYNLHEVSQATGLFEQSLALFRQLGDQLNTANVLSALAHVIGQQGNYTPQVKAYLAESLAIHRALEQADGIAQVLHNQGALETLAGNYAAATAALREALLIYRAMGDKREVAWTSEALGEAEGLQGHYVAARTHLAEALEMFQALGDQWGLALTQHHLAQVERREGNLAAALRGYRQSLSYFVTVENRHMIARCLAGLGGVALAEHQPERATHLLAAAQTIFDKLPPFLTADDLADYQKMAAQARITLGEEAFQCLWRKASVLPAEQAVALAFAL
jgi:tetratricopeptide (TPR) repeat protein